MNVLHRKFHRLSCHFPEFPPLFTEQPWKQVQCHYSYLGASRLHLPQFLSLLICCLATTVSGNDGVRFVREANFLVSLAQTGYLNFFFTFATFDRLSVSL